ncbi:MAG: hypothetical protein V8T12_02550, partial [Parabacteroides johnsonii]
ITNALSQHKKAKGEYYLYKKTYLGKSDWYGGYSYVDLLVPGVTEKFIDLTMKGYEKTIKDEFGKSVFGIFTRAQHQQSRRLALDARLVRSIP